MATTDEDSRLQAELEFEQQSQDLNLLVSKIKRDPDGYSEEMVKLVKQYLSQYELFKKKPLKRNVELSKLSVFLSQVFEYFRGDLGFLITSLTDLLSTYSSQMNFHNREKAIQSLIIISKKGFWNPLDAVKYFSTLLLLEDKSLRSLCERHIFSIIRKSDQGGKTSVLHKGLLDYIRVCMNVGKDELAARMIKIAVDLYNKKIWTDNKVVNLISEGCSHSYEKIVNISCYFLIQTTEQLEQELKSEDEEESEDDMAELKAKNKYMKKTQGRERKLKSELKKHKRRLQRKEKLSDSRRGFPIDQIYNSQSFTEALFDKLKNCKHSFGTKQAMMAVVSRMIGRHRLIIPGFYPFLQKYLKHGNKQLSHILAFLAEACHPLVPSDALDPVLKFLIMNFANESCNEPNIVMGVNCIKQMCARMPMLIEEEDLNYVCSLRKYKHKQVYRAVKGLINLYRDLCPAMLRKEHRGRMKKLDDDDAKLGKRSWLFGEVEVAKRVDGAELLGEDEDGVPVEEKRMLTADDFRRIRKLKKIGLMKKKGLLKNEEGEEKAIHKAEIDVLKLKDRYNMHLLEKDEKELQDEIDAIEEMGLEGEEDGEEDVGEGDQEEEDDGEEEIEIEEGENISFEENDKELQKAIMEELENSEEGDSDKEAQLQMLPSDDEFWDSDSDDVDETDPYSQNNGFLSGQDIYKPELSRKQKIELSKEMNKQKMKEKKLGSKLERHGRRTNEAKKKNKPFAMALEKVRRKNDQSLKTVYEKISRTKNQLGKISKSLKGQNRLRLTKRNGGRRKGGRKG